MLQFLDILFTIVHLAITGFNLLGWIWPATQKAHFISILITAASWFLLGIWYGIGYCPVTDWQWQVKEKLGEHHLPASFITYMAEKITGKSFSPVFMDTITVICFGLAAGLSVYVNFIKPGHNRNRIAR
jgi:hypothetical protein